MDHFPTYNSKLRPKEKKCHHENNLCAICGKGDHKVAMCAAYAKGRASHLRTEETQTPPKAMEPPQSPEVTEMLEEDQGN